MKIFKRQIPELTEADETELGRDYLHAHNRGSISSVIDRSINKTMPWVALAMLVGGVALGLSVAAYGISQTQVERAMREKAEREQAVNNRLQISENHWRDLEVAEKVDKSDIQRLKEELSHDRRR